MSQLVTSPNRDQHRMLQQLLDPSRRMPEMIYPWDGLREELEGSAQPVLPLIAYGSLINAESASLTLARQGPRRPILMFGAQRRFNYVIPFDNPRYGSPNDARESAALNVLVTGDVEHHFNGLLLNIELDDIEATRQREIGYDLVPLPSMFMDDPDALPFVAWTLVCPPISADGVRRVDETLLPHRIYYKVCRDGSASLGDEFLQTWLDTTYLADGKTLAREWEAVAFEEGS